MNEDSQVGLFTPVYETAWGMFEKGRKCPETGVFLQDTYLYGLAIPFNSELGRRVFPFRNISEAIQGFYYMWDLPVDIHMDSYIRPLPLHEGEIYRELDNRNLYFKTWTDLYRFVCWAELDISFRDLMQLRD